MPAAYGCAGAGRRVMLRRVVDMPEVGDRVEVRTRFDEAWARGFEVAEVTEKGFRVRRLSDGRLLPIEFVLDEVRRERKRGLWWY